MKPVVLYAEDDSNDVLLCQRALEHSGLPIDLRTVDDGAVIISWLLGHGIFSDRVAYPLPTLIVTDSKMPIKGGLDVLKCVRSHDELKNIPVILHYGSIFPQDLGVFTALGVKACVEKHSNCRDLVGVVADILKLTSNSTEQISTPSGKMTA